MPLLVYRTPSSLEESLHDALGDMPVRELAPVIAELSALFTSQRAIRPENYLNTPERRAAYTSYFLTVNYSKLHAIFDELRPVLVSRLAELNKMRGKGESVFRMVDIGAGPCTMALAAMEYVHAESPDTRLEFVSVDNNLEILQLGREIFERFRAQLGIEPSCARLQILKGELARPALLHVNNAFDVVVLANVWNEWVEATSAGLEIQARQIRYLVEKIRSDGSLILIEPALKETSRTLHYLHDEILERLQGVNIFAPCVHQQKCPCVASENKKDWCHSEHAWEPGERIQAVDRLIGNRKDALKFSYLVLRKDGKNVLDLQTPSIAREDRSNCWRVVSERIVEKGKQRAFMCGERGRIQFTRLDRQASSSNQAFENLTRGSLVRLSRVEAREKEIRVTEKTTVTKI